MEESLKSTAEGCRGGMRAKHGIERGPDGDRRVEYFKGEKLVSYLLGGSGSSEKKKEKKKEMSVEEAGTLARSMLKAGYYHRAKKVQRGVFEPAVNKKGIEWDAKEYYVWDVEGDKKWSFLLTGALIVGALAVTAFPIWPHVLKVYLWYCSVTLLIFMVVFLTLRFVLFLDFWILGYDFWIFPNLFDETLSVADSFKPALSFEAGAPNQRYYRAALVAAFVSFSVYCYNQPTDFDYFVAAQKDFVADLYEGKLLTDTSQRAKDDIDLLKRPSFEELAQEEANFAQQQQD